jgi:DivIVA domain-containing protein
MTKPIDQDRIDDSGQIDLPQFASVMRGYDRGQVDDYVARLIDFLGDAEQRANRAERSFADAQRRIERLNDELRRAIERQQSEPSAGQPYAGLGERVEGILRLAAEEADDLREQGRAQAADLVEQARRQREQEVAAAERELAKVAERRDGVVAELRKVQDVLATLGLRQALDEESPSAAAEQVERAVAEVSGDGDETTVVNLREAARRVDATG